MDTQPARPPGLVRLAIHVDALARTPRAALLVGALGVAVLSTGTGFAYWAASGAGSGAAAAGTATPLTTVVTTASATSLLYPGGPAADVRLTVSNPNPYPVTITSVSANGAVTAGAGAGTCVTTGVTLATPTAGLPFTVPARAGTTNGSATVTLTGAAQMSSASETGCQGRTFTLPVALTGASG